MLGVCGICQSWKLPRMTMRPIVGNKVWEYGDWRYLMNEWMKCFEITMQRNIRELFVALSDSELGLS